MPQNSYLLSRYVASLHLYANRGGSGNVVQKPEWCGFRPGEGFRPKEPPALHIYTNRLLRFSKTTAISQ